VASAYDNLLIGALLVLPFSTINRRVFEAYAAAGFTDLRPAHTPVFQYLLPEGDRIVDLAARAQTSKQAMGYLVAHLEKAGYLERIPDPRDGRAQIVRRTKKGWKVNRLARQTVQEIQNEWAQVLGEEKMLQLLHILRELVQQIGYDYIANKPSTAAHIDGPASI
jgi:DNA-binding MarR family transcriptional regulator